MDPNLTILTVNLKMLKEREIIKVLGSSGKTMMIIRIVLKTKNMEVEITIETRIPVLIKRKIMINILIKGIIMDLKERKTGIAIQIRILLIIIIQKTSRIHITLIKIAFLIGRITIILIIKKKTIRLTLTKIKILITIMKKPQISEAVIMEANMKAIKTQITLATEALIPIRI